jgi:hypothetical protein
MVEVNDRILLNMAINHAVEGYTKSYLASDVGERQKEFKETVLGLYNLYKEIHNEIL